MGNKADYLLAVKGNQPSLHLPVASAFAPAQTASLTAIGQRQSSVDLAHGRFVHRECWVADNDGRVDPAEWHGCRTLGLVKTTRIEEGRMGDTESWMAQVA